MIHVCFTLFKYVVFSPIQHYVIKFVSDLRQVDGFLRVLRFPLPIKLTCHDIAEILLPVALNTITLTLTRWLSPKNTKVRKMSIIRFLK